MPLWIFSNWRMLIFRIWRSENPVGVYFQLQSRISVCYSFKYVKQFRYKMWNTLLLGSSSCWFLIYNVPLLNGSRWMLMLAFAYVLHVLPNREVCFIKYGEIFHVETIFSIYERFLCYLGARIWRTYNRKHVFCDDPLMTSLR